MRTAQIHNMLQEIVDYIFQAGPAELEEFEEQLETEQLDAPAAAQPGYDILRRVCRERLFQEFKVVYEEDVAEALEDLVLSGELLGRTAENGTRIYRRRRPN